MLLCADMKVNDFEAVSFWCQKTGIDFILVGPEDPLADGIADHLKSKGAFLWLL